MGDARRNIKSKRGSFRLYYVIPFLLGLLLGMALFVALTYKEAGPDYHFIYEGF